MLAELGIEVSINVHTDSSTAKSISLRKGAGKIRHIETNQLWLQDKVKEKIISVKKIGTEENPADLFTKHLSREVIDKHLHKLGFRRESGRHDLAPKSEFISNEIIEDKKKKVSWADQNEDDEEGDDPWSNYGINSISQNDVVVHGGLTEGSLAGEGGSLVEARKSCSRTSEINRISPISCRKSEQTSSKGKCKTDRSFGPSANSNLIAYAFDPHQYEHLQVTLFEQPVAGLAQVNA